MAMIYFLLIVLALLVDYLYERVRQKQPASKYKYNRTERWIRGEL
jgi:hypothetical protein